MGYISTRMMESEDAFSDMGSLKQQLELPPEYAYDDGESNRRAGGRELGVWKQKKQLCGWWGGVGGWVGWGLTESAVGAAACGLFCMCAGGVGRGRGQGVICAGWGFAWALCKLPASCFTAAGAAPLLFLLTLSYR